MASSDKKVDLIVIGAMKCGTTALHGYLDQLEAFTVSSLKETDFFKSPDTVGRGVAWYHGSFRSETTFWSESSPNYTKRHLFDGVAERIHTYNPDCKFVYIVRSPVDRMVSHYLHNRYQGREKLGFSDAIREDDNYLLTTKYYFQLEPYIQQFGKDRILLLEYSELRSNPETAISKVCKFMSPDQKIDFEISPLETHVTAHKTQNNVLGRFISDLLGNSSIKSLLVKIPLPLSLFRSKRKIAPPQVTQQDKAFIQSQIGEDLLELHREFNVHANSMNHPAREDVHERLES